MLFLLRFFASHLSIFGECRRTFVRAKSITESCLVLKKIIKALSVFPCDRRTQLLSTSAVQHFILHIFSVPKNLTWNSFLGLKNIHLTVNIFIVNFDLKCHEEVLTLNVGRLIGPKLPSGEEQMIQLRDLESEGSYLTVGSSMLFDRGPFNHSFSTCRNELKC